MSGICGIVQFNGIAADSKVLGEMAAAAAHRGPDGSRCWLEGPAGVAHLALHITLESERECLPLVSEQRDVVLTADARVDNRAELCRILTSKGYLAIREPTDADLLLAAYRCWDTDCPRHLLGDFAFAIWDAKKQRLFAARDVMGQRALYYRIEPQRALFATEVKQILVAPHVPIRIFEPAIAALLAGTIGSLDWTCYEGITQLPPGHALVVESGQHRVWRYRDIDPEHRIRYADENQYVEHFLDLFTDAVRCRVRSVKPVGLFLSGGMDSGCIASTVGWLRQRCKNIDLPILHAFSWAFNELTQCDERHISTGITGHYHLPETHVLADTAWPMHDYPADGPDRDEPFMGVFQTLYARGLTAARNVGIKLMLSGDSGDAMVGGRFYDYVGLVRPRYWRTLWRELQAHSQELGIPVTGAIKRHLLMMALLWPQERGGVYLRRLVQGDQRRSVPAPSYPGWIRPEFATRVGLPEILEQDVSSPRIQNLARQQRYYAIFWPMDVYSTVWSERLRARFGLGHAEPWSDRRIIDFVLAVPQRLLNLPSEPKRMARRAMRGIMPEDVRQSTRKIFASPLYERALKGQARDKVLDLIQDSQAAARGYIDQTALRQSYDAICRGEHGTYGLWEALTLEMWLRQYWS